MNCRVTPRLHMCTGVHRRTGNSYFDRSNCILPKMLVNLLMFRLMHAYWLTSVNKQNDWLLIWQWPWQSSCSWRNFVQEHSIQALPLCIETALLHLRHQQQIKTVQDLALSEYKCTCGEECHTWSQPGTECVQINFSPSEFSAVKYKWSYSLH